MKKLYLIIFSFLALPIFINSRSTKVPTRKRSIERQCKYAQRNIEKTQKLIENYLFAEREPLRDEILELIEGEKPSVLKRKKLGDQILNKILGFVDTFINGITGG